MIFMPIENIFTVKANNVSLNIPTILYFRLKFESCPFITS